MSISSVSASNIVANYVLPSIGQTTSSQDQTQVTQTASTTSATKVTLSSSGSGDSYYRSLTYSQMVALANSEALSNQKADYSSDNSLTILMTGKNAMASAMQSFGSDWEDEKTTIAAQRPDLLNQQWDITSDKGTIQVVSNTMSTADKSWLTGVLNQNKSLVADTQAINTVMVSTFGGTADEAAHDSMGMTLSSLNQSSIDGTVHYLALLAGANSNATGGSGFTNTLQVDLAASSNIPVAGKIEGNGKTSAIQAPFQNGDYAEALNVAYIQFLHPAFAASSVQDGTTDPLAGLGVPTDYLSSAETSATRLSGIMMSTSNFGMDATYGYTQKWVTDTEATLQSALGANYRTYGEALTSSDTASPTTSPTAVNTSQSAT